MIHTTDPVDAAPGDIWVLRSGTPDDPHPRFFLCVVTDDGQTHRMFIPEVMADALSAHSFEAPPCIGEAWHHLTAWVEAGKPAPEGLTPGVHLPLETCGTDGTWYPMNTINLHSYLNAWGNAADPTLLLHGRRLIPFPVPEPTVTIELTLAEREALLHDALGAVRADTPLASAIAKLTATTKETS